jgi:hypothetical protein
MNCYVFDAISVGRLGGFFFCNVSSHCLILVVPCLSMFVVQTCFATQFVGSSRKYDKHMLLSYIQANFFFFYQVKMEAN